MTRVLILTPLPIEIKAVLKFFETTQDPEVRESIAFEKGTFTGKHQPYSIIVCEPGAQNTPMALATEKSIKLFNPHIALLIGIAGGVKDVQPGDVVIAKKAYGYESGKESKDVFWARPSVESFSHFLLANAQLISRRDDWKRRATGADRANVVFGPIAAGDKVIVSSQSETYQRLKLHYNDTTALEMEAIGFATAIQNHREVHGLAIRGISDLLDHKSDEFQAMAAENAAAFAFELLYHLDAKELLRQTPGTATSASNIHVSNSENVVIGSNIKVNGDFHLGNKNTTKG